MLHKWQKYLLSTLVLLFVLLGISIADNWQGLNWSAAKDVVSGNNNASLGTMKVYVLDVGQGDAIYIRTPEDQDILIDGGPDKKVLAELGKVMPFWDKKIEVMILSHAHSDHVAGLVEILKRYDVDHIYYSGPLHTASDYLAWMDEIKNKKIPLHLVKQYEKLVLGDNDYLEFLYPLISLENVKMDNLNNSSIVNRLVFGSTQFLFMGDAEEKVEKELLSKNINVSADIIKIGHHGSNTSSSESFLQAVNPTAAVISVGVNNTFGHPSARIVDRLARLGINTFRTDQSGTVTFISDGNSIEIK